MIIDISDIQAFVFCPIYQKYKSTKVFTPYVSTIDKYENDMHKFTYAYNSSLDVNGKIDIEEVKTIFGSLWLGTKSQEDFVFIDTGDKRDTYSNLRKKGINDTIEFHNYNLKNPYKPICINYKYKVPIIKGLYLSGTIDLIKEVDNKIIVVNQIARSSSVNINNSIETIAMAYAFRHIFNMAEDETVIYAFDKAKELIVTINDESFKKLKLNVVNVAKSIKNNLLYFTSQERCMKCPYNSICKDSKYLNEILKGI